MKHAAPLVAMLASAIFALAAADCVADSNTARIAAGTPFTASMSVFVGHQIKFYLCPTVESSCIHPDPQQFPTLYPGSSLQWYQVCVTPGSPTGENAISATENGVYCQVVTNPNNATCGSVYTVAGDLGVYLTYYPCANWWGTVTFVCKSYRQGDDWTNNVNPSTNPTVDNWQLTAAVNVQSCNATSCNHGTCSFPSGCVCNAGWSGDLCDISGAVPLYVSLLAIFVATLATLIFNL